MSELDPIEEQRRLVQCYGITGKPDGGIHAVRLAVQKAMDCKIGGRIEFDHMAKGRQGLAGLSGSSKRVAGWTFNHLSQKVELCSLNPAKPRPTMFRVNRFAFFGSSKSGTVGSQPVAVPLTPSKTDTLT